MYPFGLAKRRNKLQQEDQDENVLQENENGWLVPVLPGLDLDAYAREVDNDDQAYDTINPPKLTADRTPGVPDNRYVSARGRETVGRSTFSQP